MAPEALEDGYDHLRLDVEEQQIVAAQPVE
jgi:hypothetical protein